MSRWHVSHAPELRDETDRALVQAIFDGEKRTSLPSILGISSRQVRLRLNRIKALIDAPSWAAFGATALDRGWVRDSANGEAGTA